MKSTLAAAGIIAGVLVVGTIAATLLFVRSRVTTEPVPQDEALAELAQARTRFAGQTPLIELASDDQPILHPPAAAAPQALHALRALVYDPARGTLSRMDLPGWVVRAISVGGRVRLANLGVTEASDTPQRLTLEDLERHGPGIVMDISRRRRQILIWTD